MWSKIVLQKKIKMVRFYARERSDTCIQTPPQSLFPLLNLGELFMSLRSTVPDKNSDSLLCLSKFTPIKHELDSIYENDSFAEPSRFYKYTIKRITASVFLCHLLSQAVS